MAARGASVAEGIAGLAAALVDLPAERAAPLAGTVEGPDASTALLGRGWDLLAFTRGGAVLVELVDASGARIELVEGAAPRGERLSRVTSHGAARAAWGAPPGRRVSAMVTVPGPGGAVGLSCGFVLRLRAEDVAHPLRTAWALAFHCAMHGAERQGLPSGDRLSRALGTAVRDLGMPRGPRGRVAWADEVAQAVVDELGGVHGPLSMSLAHGADPRIVSAKYRHRALDGPNGSRGA